LPGGTDPDNRREFPGGWVGDRHDAFTPAGRSAEEENVYAHVKKLLALRKQIEPLRKGKTVKLMAGTDACAFARVTRDNFAVTVCNNAGRRQLLEIPLAGIGQPNIPALTDRLTGLGTVRISQNKLILMVAPRSAAILTP
jgi:hypothetical protein